MSQRITPHAFYLFRFAFARLAGAAKHAPVLRPSFSSGQPVQIRVRRQLRAPISRFVCLRSPRARFKVVSVINLLPLLRASLNLLCVNSSSPPIHSAHSAFHHTSLASRAGGRCELLFSNTSIASCSFFPK